MMSRSPRNTDFVIHIDFAKRLSMMTRTEVGENVRQYFIEIEKEYRAIVNAPVSVLDLFEAQLKLAQEQQADM